ncbi:MAG: hypothetical protein ABIH78_01980 [Candidatus Peregrinibacteria bacterium]
METPQELDKRDIAEHGFTSDYFNELPATYEPEDILEYMTRCKSDNPPKTYSEYATPEMLQASNPDTVALLDEFMAQLIEAAERDDANEVKRLMQAILDMGR